MLRYMARNIKAIMKSNINKFDFIKFFVTDQVLKIGTWMVSNKLTIGIILLAVSVALDKVATMKCHNGVKRFEIVDQRFNDEKLGHSI